MCVVLAAENTDSMKYNIPIEWVLLHLPVAPLNCWLSVFFRGFFRNRNLCVFKLGILHQLCAITDSIEFGAFGVQYILDIVNAFCGLVVRLIL